jgi:hypothetical protein
MSNPSEIPDPHASDAQRVRAATLYSRTAFWIAGTALCLAAIAAGPTLFRGVAPGAVDLWSIGLWTLLVVLTVAELFVLRRTRPGAARVIGLAAMAGVGVCMAIAYSSFGTATSSAAMIAAGILIVVAGFSFWRHNRTLR